DFSGLKTLDAVMLIVVEPAKQAQARLVKGLGDGLRIHRPVNLIRHLSRLPRRIMADHRLRTRHDASAPGDFPLVHGFATPVCD
ncbi:hypothetical protein C2W62_53730, partial [Candidatus Entotheonella serta]